MQLDKIGGDFNSLLKELQSQFDKIGGDFNNLLKGLPSENINYLALKAIDEKILSSIRVYEVGGCVRDILMGLEPKDVDLVVVGATEEVMLALGFEQVGKDFPVFLHPKTGDEYALARKERKTAAGYNGFSVEVDNVSLEDDLLRRDLTINAMAKDSQGNIIDPYHGQEDLKNHVLRHVSKHFAEDPVRILRIARFSARYNFSIHPDTISMMKDMVDNGEFDSLTGERVWKEFEKVLTEKNLVNFFDNLETIGALSKVPGFTSIKEKEFFKVIQTQSSNRFISNLLHTFSQMSKEDLKPWKMPAEHQKLINHFNDWKDNPLVYSYLSVEEKLNLIQQHRALHSTEDLFTTLENVILYSNWKNNQTVSFESQKNIILSDIEKLKEIDYPSVIAQAKIDKVKPNEVVKSAQIALLNNKKQFKI